MNRRGVRRWTARAVARFAAAAAAAAAATAQLGLEPASRHGIQHPRGLAPALADVDGDGDLDLFVAPSQPWGNHALWLNDGAGRFVNVTATHLPPPRSNPPAYGPIHARDFTGDGAVDLFWTTGIGVRYLLVNDGTGRFTDVSRTAIPFHHNWSDGSAVLDFDRDGDLDLVIGHNGFGNGRDTSIWENDGTGTFIDRGEPPVVYADPWNVVAGDFNGDGWDDFVTGHWSWFTVQLNDRAGNFRLHQSHPANSSGRLAVGDIDGDGDLDVAQDPQYVWLNDGLGNFTDHGATNHPGRLQPGFLSVAIVLVDLDSDGDLDWLEAGAMVPGSPMTNVDVLENDGTGRFQRRTRLDRSWTMPLYAAGIATGDIDGDGDVDVVHDDGQLGVRVLVNTRQHVSASAAPTIGGTYRLDVTSTWARSAVVLAGAQPASLPVPGFGTLRVDPATAATSPLLAMPPRDEGGLWLAVPDDPALRGASLYFQAAFVDTAIPPRGALSNLWVETIR